MCSGRFVPVRLLSVIVLAAFWLAPLLAQAAGKEIKGEIDLRDELKEFEESGSVSLPPKPLDAKEEALCDACNKGDSSTAIRLIKEGVNPNADCFPLGWASFRGRLPLLSFLLDHGANPNLLPSNGIMPSALHKAVHGRGGHPHLGHPADTMACAARLLSAGADPNIMPQYGETPLMWAAMYNDLDMALLLLKWGAKINAKTASGKTALFFARQKAHLDMVRALLDLGAE